MVERFRVLQENGYGEVERQMQILQENGYTIKWIENGMVPFCMGSDGQPVMVPGWSIVAERPRPEQTCTTPSQGAGYTTPNRGADAAPWLWE